MLIRSSTNITSKSHPPCSTSYNYSHNEYISQTWYLHKQMENSNYTPPPQKSRIRLNLKNYRPVSNLSFLSKVLEQCILTQFNNHCNEYSLMPDYQSAYGANYSCEISLLRVINDMLWAMEHK